MSSDNKKPDLYAYVQKNDKAPLLLVGAAWYHNKGEGLNVVLTALPVDGRITLFPPKAEDDKPAS
ncbi:MAG: hypothetical protein ACRBBV_09390 [Paracoccaceae bacterium]